MKDHVASSHLIKFDAFRVSRDHVQNPYNVETAPFPLDRVVQEKLLWL